MSVIGVISIGNNIRAELTDDSGWVCSDERIQKGLNSLYPFPDNMAEGYDPNPGQTVLERAAKAEGAEILENVKATRYEGRVY